MGSVDRHGSPSSMWLTGTLVYGLVVIVVNVKILFSTHTHTALSLLINVASMLSFFGMFFLENTFTFVPQLNAVFFPALRIPSFYFLIVFFIFYTLVTEKLMYWTGEYYKEIKENKKIE